MNANALRYLLLLICTSVLAQDYPSKPVTATIPFSAGSASDGIARLVLNRMEGPLGQRFIVPTSRCGRRREV